MLKLTDRKWKSFCVRDVFKITTGSNIPNYLLAKGKLPRISAKNSSNGIVGFTSERNLSLYRLNQNCISVSFLASVFYQPYMASYDMKIHSLTIEGVELNRYIGLFIATECKRQFSKFSYGNQLSSSDLSKQYILLPISPLATPDWAFMEAYMKQVEYGILKTTIEKLKEKITNVPQLNLGKIEWKEFALKDIFSIGSGVRLTKADMISGNRPFIGATDNNNGITEWVDNINESIDKNVLGINYNGSVCESFYHPYECIFSDDVKRFHLLERENSKYIMLFLKTIIYKQKVKYSYGYKFNENRMKSLKILLPITSDGTPNWQYMEDYMRYVEQQKLKSIVDAFSERVNNSISPIL